MREPLPPAARRRIENVGELRAALGQYLDSGERAYVFLGSDDDLKAKVKEHKDGSITWSVKFRTPPRRKA